MPGGYTLIHRRRRQNRGREKPIRVLRPGGDRPISRTAVVTAQEMTACGAAEWVDADTIRLRWDPFIERAVKRRVLQRDKNTCVFCGQPATTVDHLIPTARGGITRADNLVAACHRHNELRQNRDLGEFINEMGLQSDHPLIVELLSAGYERRCREAYAYLLSAERPELWWDTATVEYWCHLKTLHRV